MDKQSYARYLIQLMDEEVEADEVIDADSLYGYFQMYMPSGKGVEATFEPLQDGEAYLQRIEQMYDILDPADFGGDTVPAYFNSKTADVPPDVLKGHGEQLIKGLKELMDECEELEGAADAASYLSGIKEVQLLPHGKINTIRQSRDPDVYEALFEVINEHTDDDEPIEVLDEAYYSIACNYWISYYLQWHRYGLKVDPLAPYFELYRLGYSAVFYEHKLYIGS
ncbi:hypothetical protein M3650_19120 [Paenibacillus sp. MER TA 81-3]|uniref:hypothetical protein n=1 Tax=Paenibacillus sp. MER TA 81-3 TaxID=2939573 RepID=UPI0020412121|nr:hypothetical protein [Paenibacillus sp. MER TA 81-3]MCM3340682.1 hypothetical protein [Paenibacillus sp. MER TA 81-3]